MENKIEKTCPYCGQILCVGWEDERPEMICRCPGALAAQAREENTRVLMESVDLLYGEDCQQQEQLFCPVNEEVYTLLCQLAEKVGHEEIGTISFGLRDGTAGRISIKGVERKKNIQRKFGK